MLLSDAIQNSLKPRSKLFRRLVPNLRRTYSELIQNLHPTPAVGGLPKAASLDFIQTHENYDRRFYSGVLGPIGSRVKEVFVNLRCGEIQNQQLNLYVGGGVTAASQVEKEWRELMRKSETLLCCL